MTDNLKKKVVALYDDDPQKFSCHRCNLELSINSCEGCPIYCQTWSND